MKPAFVRSDLDFPDPVPRPFRLGRDVSTSHPQYRAFGRIAVLVAVYSGQRFAKAGFVSCSDRQS
jgi:hypothetical protein